MVSFIVEKAGGNKGGAAAAAETEGPARLDLRVGKIIKVEKVRHSS